MRLFVVIALLLGGVYYFNPFGVLDGVKKKVSNESESGRKEGIFRQSVSSSEGLPGRL